jgi:hypothetical protein
MFLLPILIGRWERLDARVVGALLIVPISFVLGQFENGVLARLTMGSLYAWALLLCLAMLVREELRQAAAEPVDSRFSENS